MKSTLLKINSDHSLMEVTQKLVDLFVEHKYLRLSVLPGKDRSIEQNATWSGMYKAIWIQTDFESFDYARAYCKWHIGIPILKRDFEGFEDSFNAIFKNIDYEACLRLMNANKLFPKDGFPVTSCFGVKQGTEYIENICRNFSGTDAPYVDFSKLLEDA